MRKLRFADGYQDRTVWQVYGLLGISKMQNHQADFDRGEMSQGWLQRGRCRKAVAKRQGLLRLFEISQV